MPPTTNFNVDDPVKQEQIRRGSHEYVPTAGKHGAYLPKAYVHQDYPKMMGKWPKPQHKDFLTHNGMAISPGLGVRHRGPYASGNTAFGHLHRSGSDGSVRGQQHGQNPVSESRISRNPGSTPP